jgi:hypothetical protein
MCWEPTLLARSKTVKQRGDELGTGQSSFVVYIQRSSNSVECTLKPGDTEIRAVWQNFGLA